MTAIPSQPRPCNGRPEVCAPKCSVEAMTGKADKRIARGGASEDEALSKSRLLAKPITTSACLRIDRQHPTYTSTYAELLAPGDFDK